MDKSDYAEKRVLIIDDQPEARSYTRDMLREFGANDVGTVASGEEALNLLREERYDLVLADYNLGDGKDGQQVLEELRHSGLISRTAAFVMITADSSPEMVMGALEYQPDGYIMKPYTKSELRKRLDRLLDGKQALAPIESAIESGALEEALAACDEVQRKHPQQLIHSLRLRGGVLLRLQRYDEALHLYQAVVKKRPIAWARLGLGKTLYYLDRMSEAEAVFQGLVDENAAYVEASDWLARVMIDAERFEEAEKVLLSAAAKSPKAVLRQMQLAKVAELNGSAKVSENAYRKAVALGRNSVYKSAGNYFGLAKLIDQRLDGASPRDKRRAGDEAVRILKEADRNFSDRSVKATAAAMRAKTCRKLGKNMEADAAQKRAEELYARIDDPPADLVELMKPEEGALDTYASEEERLAAFERCESLNNTGVELFQAGRTEEAVEKFREAAQSSQASPAVLMNALQATMTLTRNKTPISGWRDLCEEWFERLESLEADDARRERMEKLRKMYSQLEA